MTSLTGSAMDVGYVKVTALINNQTKVQVMLSSRSTNSFLNCPQEVLNACGDASGCGVVDHSSASFEETFVGSTVQGRYLRQNTLCIADWCSNPFVPIEPISTPVENPNDTRHDVPIEQVDNVNGSLAPTASPSMSPTLSPTLPPPKPHLGCSVVVTGSLKELPDHGVWGLSPEGLHPDFLTLCFGTKRRAGRIVAAFEPDASPTHWLTFHSSFVLDIQSTRCPLQFLAPDTSWTDEDDPDEVDINTGSNNGTQRISTRIDFSSTYSFLPLRWFVKAKQSLMAACQSLGCKGYRDFSDGAALVCFRFVQDSDENSLPDLEWRIENQVHLLVPPSRYLFTTEDGSRCVGVFESAFSNLAVLGLNMLVGLRLRIDYASSRLKLDTCVPTNLLPFDENPPPIPGGDSGTGDGTNPVELPVDHGVDDDLDSTSWLSIQSLLIVIAILGAIIGGIYVAVQYRKKQSHFGQKKKSIFRTSSLIRNSFKSRKQTFKTVKFVEEEDSSSGEEGSVVNEIDAEEHGDIGDSAAQMTMMPKNSPRSSGQVNEEEKAMGEGRGDEDEDKQRLLGSASFSA